MTKYIVRMDTEDGFHSEIRTHVGPLSDLGAAQDYALLHQSAMCTADVFPPSEPTW